MFNITFSKYHEELRKDAEERLEKEKKFHREGYTYEIVLVPTGVVFNKEGRSCVVANPDINLIRKEIK